ncbi:OmpA family protein [Polaromonas sp. P2-4]|nr:OmpA family protein [Polaromonas sp. P2-4]
MFSQDDSHQGAALVVIFGVVALVVATVVGSSVYRQRSASVKTAPAASSAALAPAVATPAGSQSSSGTPQSAAQTASDAASVKVENGVVKFYFASGKADLAAGAGEALADVVKGAKAGRKLVISGFHDATGDAAKNAALARQRAEAVRDALKTAGVSPEQIELKKPEQMAGGSDAEARRVEISLQ